MKLLLVALFLISTSFTLLASTADTAQGRKVFETNCATCHGSNGAGTKAGQEVGAPDLRSQKIQQHSNQVWKQQIKNGKNSMPPFGAMLSSQQIDSIVKYVRTFATKQ
jgi:mono/diheme cytochrome c family protein